MHVTNQYLLKKSLVKEIFLIINKFYQVDCSVKADSVLIRISYYGGNMNNNLLKKIQNIYFANLSKTKAFNIPRKEVDRQIAEMLKQQDYLECYFTGIVLNAFLAFVSANNIDGSNKRMTYVIYAFKNKKDKQWIKEKYIENKQKLRDESILEIDIHDHEMINFLTANGNYIESLHLVGNVSTALKVIKDHYPNLEEGLDPSIKIEPFYNKNEIKEISEMWLKEFTARPEHFYAATRKSYQIKQKEHLNNLVKDIINANQQWMAYVFKNANDKIIGWADLHSFGENHSGIQFCFAEELQGKKYGIFAYKLLLQDLKDAGAKTFSGNTSNPAVLKMGIKFRRIPTYAMLKNGNGHFPTEYFTKYVTELKKISST
jgi:hypothetical protein